MDLQPVSQADSSRAVALARKPCEQADWQSTAAPHKLLDVAGAWSCRRCKLEVLSQFAASAARSTCPVPTVVKEGQPWPEGEASIRADMGRVKGFRRWCCMPVGPEPAEEAFSVGVLEADAAGVEAASPHGTWAAAAVAAGVADHVLVVREPGEQGACAGLGGGASG